MAVQTHLSIPTSHVGVPASDFHLCFNPSFLLPHTERASWVLDTHIVTWMELAGPSLTFYRHVQFEPIQERSPYLFAFQTNKMGEKMYLPAKGKRTQTETHILKNAGKNREP